MANLQVSVWWLIPLAVSVVYVGQVLLRFLQSKGQGKTATDTTGSVKLAAPTPAGASTNGSSSAGGQYAISPEEYRTFKLVAKTNETPGTSNAAVYRFRFALPDASATLGLPIGKHLVLRFKDADGRPVSRQYTPITSDSDKGHFDLLIKLYPAGKMSQYLAALPIGSPVEVRGPMGMLEYKGRGTIALNKGGWRTRQVRKIGMIAGGSGLTPMYQIATHILRDKGDSTQVSFIFANVTETDIMMRKELDALAAQHAAFNLFYTINPPREGETIPDTWKGGVGFVSAAMIDKHMPQPSEGDGCIVMLCGPKPMVDAMTKLLKEAGYTEEQIWVF